MSTFTGFSEEDLKRMKSESSANCVSDHLVNTSNAKKIQKIGTKIKRPTPQYKVPILQNNNVDDALDIAFDKCKLSLKSPPLNMIDSNMENDKMNNKFKNNIDTKDEIINNNDDRKIEIGDGNTKNVEDSDQVPKIDDEKVVSRKNSASITPDVIRCVENYTEDELAAHRIKLQELQLQQKLMEEQNKKRKEMLSKALADRTKQTEEEVMKLDKIKKELQILDGQFSQDVAVLRKKIDQACVSFADAEKLYLKIEKEFLQAKISLQKEREKKELLTEHLCALITHNETRKAQKLETLMLQLAIDKNKQDTPSVSPIIIDGVDERTGKIVEIFPQS